MRLPDLHYNKLHREVKACDYWKVLNDEGTPLLSEEPSNLTHTIWFVVVPMSYGYAIGRLTKHTVRENDDKTITIKPGDGSSNSVLITGHHGEQWHGYVYDGEFKST